MITRNEARVWATNVEGRFDLVIRPIGSNDSIEKKNLTAVEVCDYLFSGPLVEFMEFDIKGNAVNHEAIHAEAERRGIRIVNERPCPACGNTTRADPSCPVCGVPWTSA